MWCQPKEEKDAENDLIRQYAISIKGKVVKLQGYTDDGETDGIVELNGIEKMVEARRKGYPNHSGKVSPHFKNGWKSKKLVGGIYLNERIIRKYQGADFVYLVDIYGYPPRRALISSSRVAELLGQPNFYMKSCNSGVIQSVKFVPLDWFDREF